MIIDKIIAQGCTEEVEDISTQVCDNQETNGLPDDVVLGPRGWVHVWGKEVVIGDAENQVHGSPWNAAHETRGARQSLRVRTCHQMSVSTEPTTERRELIGSQGLQALIWRLCVTGGRLLSCSPQVWNHFVCPRNNGGGYPSLQNPGVGWIQLHRKEKTSWCLLNPYLP